MSRATRWSGRDGYVAPVLFNPYTGEPRDARDIASDPQGILIVQPGAPLRPAAPTPPAQQDDEALEPDMQSAWISVQDRMPPDDTPVLVYVPGNEMLAFAIDQWQMQREAPLGWSSATIETGMGWGDHDYEDVSHWMPLTAPGHPLNPDDQEIADEYIALLRMIDEAMGDDDDPL